jgi:CheY-like chemotaxis protein
MSVILVVEDDQPTQFLLRTLIARGGYECVLATNGNEAIELLGTRTFDVIVLDLMMPVLGGDGVLQHIRESGIRTPVIVCTAAAPLASDQFDPATVRAVIRKPFDIDHFAATLATLAPVK